MTIQLRRDKEIYATDGGWFQARWHFTFDRYHDPGQMGVGALRVSGPVARPCAPPRRRSGSGAHGRRGLAGGDQDRVPDR